MDPERVASNVLPEDFDGTFRFTNYSNEDFTAKWNGMSYTFPAMKTTPMIIQDATPLEIQQIRKNFAKKFSEREFFKSSKYESLRSVEGSKDANGVMKPLMGSMMTARSYNESDLAEYIQKCLEPLPVARAIVTEAPKDTTEEKLTKTPRGKLHTRVLQEGESLIEESRGKTE